MSKRRQNRQNTPQRRVEIDGMAPQGWATSGKGRARIHVWGGLPGDVLEIGMFRRERGRVEAAIDTIVARQVETQSPRCEHFGVCGGCLWQHVPYDIQLEMKGDLVRSAFGGARLDTGCVAPVLASVDAYGYRNKNDFTFGFGQTPALGFFESELKKSGGRNKPQAGRIPDVFEVNACPLQSDLANQVLGKIRARLVSTGLSYYHAGSRKGILRSLVLRQSRASGDMLVTFVAARDCSEILEPVARDVMDMDGKIRGVVLCVNSKRSKNASPQMQITLTGQPWITEEISGLTFKVSPGTFLQVNTRQAEKLYQLALEFSGVNSASHVLDLYCGVGTLSLLLAQQAESVVGIEVVESSVIDAVENAKHNGITNCRFVCGDVTAALPDVALETPVDVVMVNPPRAGVDRTALHHIVKLAPEKIVYVSCNAETLARDLKHLVQGGYKIETVVPVDMFPQTPHVEVVTKLVKRS